MKIDKNVLIENYENLLSKLRPSRSTSFYRLTCPFCGKREAFCYIGSNLISCSRKNKCGESITIESYLSKEGYRDQDIVDMLVLNSGRTKQEIMLGKTKLEVPEKINFFSTDDGLLAKVPKKYLQNRGLSENIINSLGFINDSSSPYNKRIFIPFYEEGELVFFVARDYTGTAKQRYMNPKGMSSHDFVFNIDNVDEGDDVVIVEGVMDAMTLNKNKSTAMLTSKVGAKQVDKIWDRAPGDIIFVPDLDRAGIVSLIDNFKIFSERKPPSSNSKFYIYWIDKRRKDALLEILRAGHNKENESAMIKSIGGFKDISESGILEIKKEECEIFDLMKIRASLGLYWS